MKRILDVITVILTTIALFTASTASWIFFYQPVAPKSIHRLTG
ncbi:MAG TPA: cyclic lactone autoinducer peptide [Acetivibrio clariflavus]|nr:cyclic lactone autoinducer peptide [Acetivibrio clariflavus]